MSNRDYINGYEGNLYPKKSITRAEFAKLMDNIITKYLKGNNISNVGIKGNVMINEPDVTLKDSLINGNLILGDGIGDGDITLDNPLVLG